jgi:hypothetical protein
MTRSNVLIWRAAQSLQSRLMSELGKHLRAPHHYMGYADNLLKFGYKRLEKRKIDAEIGNRGIKSLARTQYSRIEVLPLRPFFSVEREITFLSLEQIKAKFYNLPSGLLKMKYVYF